MKTCLRCRRPAVYRKGKTLWCSKCAAWGIRQHYAAASEAEKVALDDMARALRAERRERRKLRRHSTTRRAMKLRDSVRMRARAARKAERKAAETKRRHDAREKLRLDAQTYEERASTHRAEVARRTAIEREANFREQYTFAPMDFEPVYSLALPKGLAIPTDEDDEQPTYLWGESRFHFWKWLHSAERT